MIPSTPGLASLSHQFRTSPHSVRLPCVDLNCVGCHGRLDLSPDLLGPQISAIVGPFDPGLWVRFRAVMGLQVGPGLLLRCGLISAEKWQPSSLPAVLLRCQSVLAAWLRKPSPSDLSVLRQWSGSHRGRRRRARPHVSGTFPPPAPAAAGPTAGLGCGRGSACAGHRCGEGCRCRPPWQ